MFITTTTFTRWRNIETVGRLYTLYRAIACSSQQSSYNLQMSGIKLERDPTLSTS